MKREFELTDHLQIIPKFNSFILEKVLMSFFVCVYFLLLSAETCAEIWKKLNKQIDYDFEYHKALVA